MKLINNIICVFVGFVVAIFTSIALNLLSLGLFFNLISKSKSQDILITSTGPLLYFLFAIVISILVGVFVTSKLIKNVRIINAIAVAVLYGAFNYLISQPAKSLESSYPYWFVICSYLVLIPSAFIGYAILKKFSSPPSRKLLEPEKFCTSCTADATHATTDQIDELLAHLPEWKLIKIDGIAQLQRVFRVKNFAEAMALTQAIGQLAEEFNHHPALLTEWGKVTVTWWTHKIKGLHENDLIMAAKTEKIAIQK